MRIESSLASKAQTRELFIRIYSRFIPIMHANADGISYVIRLSAIIDPASACLHLCWLLKYPFPKPELQTRKSDIYP